MHRLLLLSALVPLLAACPTVKLGTVSVGSTAPSTGTFTLVAEVEVKEVDATDGENGQPASGRGVLGMHLPQGWTVVGARMKSPSEPVARRVFASPQSAAVFAETFPTIRDSWWAFASPEQTIQQGTHTYIVEVDIDSGKAKRADIGLLMTILQDDMQDVPAPSGYAVSIKGKKTTLKSTTGPAPTVGGGTPRDKVPAVK